MYVINILLYFFKLISQEGDNPMQTQEMFWRQKYDNLEKHYTNLKNEFEIHLKSIKITTGKLIFIFSRILLKKKIRCSTFLKIFSNFIKCI